MTPDDVMLRVEHIKACAADPEAAHSMEDDLYRSVLTAIAGGFCTLSQQCASEALKSRDIEFARWCA